MSRYHSLRRRFSYHAVGDQGSRRRAQRCLARREKDRGAKSHCPPEVLSLRVAEGSRELECATTDWTHPSGRSEQVSLGGLSTQRTTPPGLPASRQASDLSARRLVRPGPAMSDTRLRRSLLQDSSPLRLDHRRLDHQWSVECTRRVDQHETTSPHPHDLRVQVDRQSQRPTISTHCVCSIAVVTVRRYPVVRQQKRPTAESREL